MRGYLFEILTAVLILQTTITEVHTYSTQSTSDGLEAADIAAIVLGVLLLVLIIVAVIVCILIKKGKLCVKEETPKVTPFLNGFSTTPGRYMYDDVYHSPDSRPLPGNKVIAESYPTRDPEKPSKKGTTPRHISRSSRHHRHENDFRETKISRPSSKHSAPTPPPTPEAEVKIPDNGRINITTSGRSPYIDRMGPRY